MHARQYVWVKTDVLNPNRHAEHLLVSNFKGIKSPSKVNWQGSY